MELMLEVEKLKTEVVKQNQDKRIEELEGKLNFLLYLPSLSKYSYKLSSASTLLFFLSIRII